MKGREYIRQSWPSMDVVGLGDKYIQNLFSSMFDIPDIKILKTKLGNLQTSVFKYSLSKEQLYTVNINKRPKLPLTMSISSPI